MQTILKPLLHYHACRHGRRHIVNFHGISQDPVLVKAEFQLIELEVGSPPGELAAKQKKGILKHLAILFPLGSDIFPIFNEKSISLILMLSAFVLITFRLLEMILQKFPNKPKK